MQNKLLTKLRFLAGLALISMYTGCSGGGGDIGARFLKVPYLLFPDHSQGMTIRWQTDEQPQVSYLYWGTSESYGSQLLVEQNSNADWQHLFTQALEDLSAATKYYYRSTVNSGEVTGSFMTAPLDTATTTTLYALGDTYGDVDAFSSVAAALMSNVNVDSDSRQTLCLHGGNFVSYGLDEDTWDDEFFPLTDQNIRTFLHSVPILGALGDRESMNSDGEEVTVDAGSLFRKYWPYSMYESASHFYYSFDYGPIHVSVIDQYTVDFDAASDQYAWLEDDIQSSDKTWKVVLMHAPAYSATPADDDLEMTENLRNELVPLFETESVHLVIQAHHNYYSRSLVDGITYLVLGGGGAALEDPDSTNEFVVTASKSHHFARIDAAGDTLTVTAIDADSNAIESFVISN